MDCLSLPFVSDFLLCLLHLRGVNCVDPKGFALVISHIFGKAFLPSGAQSDFLKPASKTGCCCSTRESATNRRRNCRRCTWKSRGKIVNIKIRLLDWNVVRDEEVCKRVRTAKDDLHDLECCKSLLHGSRDFYGKCRKSVVSILQVIAVSAKIQSFEIVAAYHQGMQARINEHKHPDRWRHVANTCPHAQHCSSMVECL